MRSSESLTSNSLESFARTAEAVAATTRKLEKAALLEDYFRQLDDEDLARAARYFAGQQFASSDARTTNVGGSILSEAMISAAGASPESLGARYARWGDAGDVAFELFVEAKPGNQPSLTLAETEGVLAQLSLTRGKKAKTQILIEALSRATALEAKYLVKLLSGDLRIGLREGLVEDAIARAFKQPLAGLPTDLIVDGEIIAARGEEILPFSNLQKRLGRKTVGEDLLVSTPVVFVTWDLLYATDRVLINDPLESRRAKLEELVSTASGSGRSNSGTLRLSKAARFNDVAVLDDEFDHARARGNEGLMIKDPSSFYKPGRRGREWLKLKKALATLDVVVTTVELGHGKRHHVLSDYTFAVRRSADDPELLNIGKAYSGLTDAEIAEMTQWFRAHTIREFAHGRVRVVESRIVIEVTFDRVQPSNRHKSGYALRFPRIVRLRPDKTVDEIDTLATVRKLVGS